jgi:hypothetical protein
MQYPWAQRLVSNLRKLLKLPVRGVVLHVAFWAWAKLSPNAAAPTLAAKKCARMTSPELHWLREKHPCTTSARLRGTSNTEDDVAHSFYPAAAGVWRATMPN